MLHAEHSSVKAKLTWNLQTQQQQQQQPHMVHAFILGHSNTGEQEYTEMSV